jgi:hypothetical protein
MCVPTMIIRRLLDLCGLLPTGEEVTKFADK